MQEQDLNRYTRQLRLKQFDHASQALLMDSCVLIMGLGGLGSPAALYLAGAGVGHLLLADHDKVEISNLHRQILYTENDIGHPKTSQAVQRLQSINRDLIIEPLEYPHDMQKLAQAVQNADIVLDCTDNFAARDATNALCVQYQTALVSGAVIRMQGQLAVFNDGPESPCYACLYGTQTETAESCSESGILGPLAGIIGSMQALEAIKLLTNLGEPLSSRLLLLDAETLQWRCLKISKDPHCPVCSSTHV